MARVFVLAIVACVLFAGCQGPPPAPSGPAAPSGDDVLATARALVTDVDGGAWFRTPGTEGNLRQARFLRDALQDLGFEARLDHFNTTLALTGDTWCRNVVAERPGLSSRTIALAAHFDSRAHADKDPDPGRRLSPVLGANDGASGVAVVLETVRALPAMQRTLRVYFFDCEDQGDSAGGWAVGARHAASALGDQEADRFDAFVLFDLVGDAQLVVPREANSAARARPLLDEAFGLAERLGLSRFRNVSGPGVFDDHVPFLERGVPAIDLIHLDSSPDGDPFPSTHHTVADDASALSADALGQAAALGFALTLRLDQKPI